MNLKNKVALVTGASTGIGRATAIELAKAGATILIVARRKDKLEETKKLIEEFGGKAIVFKADLSNLNSLNKLIKAIQEKTKRVDIIANIADVWHLNGKHFFETVLENIPEELISQSIDVGLKAPILLARAFVPKMKGWGRVISMSGSFAPEEKGCLPQYVTKKAVEMFTKQLALEYKDAGVTANSISPWYVWTEAVQELFPSLKDEAMSPEEVAKFIVYLCFDEAKNETGKVLSLKKDQKPISN